MSIAVCGADSFVRCRWLIIRRKISFTSLRHTAEKNRGRHGTSIPRHLYRSDVFQASSSQWFVELLARYFFLLQRAIERKNPSALT